MIMNWIKLNLTQPGFLDCAIKIDALEKWAVIS